MFRGFGAVSDEADTRVWELELSSLESSPEMFVCLEIHIQKRVDLLISIVAIDEIISEPSPVEAMVEILMKIELL